MPIRWSALRVMEAADMIQAHINRAVEPLECAREVVRVALQIPNLPKYVAQDFHGLWWLIDRAIGNGTSLNPDGQFKEKLRSIRDSVPEDALEAEKKNSAYGEQPSLV